MFTIYAIVTAFLIFAIAESFYIFKASNKPNDEIAEDTEPVEKMDGLNYSPYDLLFLKSKAVQKKS